jgi:hypothetical protein
MPTSMSWALTTPGTPNRRGGIFLARKSGASLSSPGDPYAKKIAELQEEQKGLAVAALDMIEGYIGDPPVARASIEDAKRDMERVQRELDAEKG